MLAGMPTHATLVGQTQARKTKRALVLIVSRADSEEPQSNMDAVVLVENGKLTQPYPENNEAAQKKFAGNYFAPGKKYRVTFGGGEVGTAIVKSWDMGCNNIHAVATVADNKRIPPRLSALATDSETLGRKPAARRAPTDAERQSVMRIVRQIYSSKGTSPGLLSTLKTTNLTATDLNGDGAFELIGSFVIETKASRADGKKGKRVNGETNPRGNARRDLLLIAEPPKLPQGPAPVPAAGSVGPSVSAEASFSAGPPFKAALVNFQSYKMPPEGFDSAVDFLDQLDLDGDGVAEVFVQNHGFDAYGYSIYNEDQNRLAPGLHHHRRRLLRLSEPPA
jgi:hypothetical protein